MCGKFCFGDSVEERDRVVVDMSVDILFVVLGDVVVDGHGLFLAIVEVGDVRERENVLCEVKAGCFLREEQREHAEHDVLQDIVRDEREEHAEPDAALYIGGEDWPVGVPTIKTMA